MFVNPVSFIFAPKSQWQKLAEKDLNAFSTYLAYPIIMIAISTYAWYYGLTEVGWVVGNGDLIKLSRESASMIGICAYFTMLIGLGIIGYLVHWMSETYGAETSIMKGVALVSFTATPFYLAGLTGIYPDLWIGLSSSLVAIGWSVYLLYSGVPLFMKIPEERGFLYASAVSGVGMVMLMVLMGATVIAWEMGFTPVFID